MIIKANIEQSELKSVYDEIVKSIDTIEQIDIDESEALASSGLISLLVSLKKSHNNIKIPLLDDPTYSLKSLGRFLYQA